MDGGSAPLPPLPPDWTIVLFDDFLGASLNASLWMPRANESHCCPQELQVYQSDNVALDGAGHLILTTLREHSVDDQGTPFNFTSGWIDTKNHFSWTYGLWEVRARLPAQAATGAWPAHWTLPDPRYSTPPNVCWPVGGEIDILEGTSNPVSNFSTASLRWGTTCGDDKQLLPGGYFFGPNGSGYDATQWHTYAALWTPGYLAFAVDGIVFENKTSSEVTIPSTPNYLILETAVAFYLPPGPSAVYPAYHEVDWVRVTAPPSGAPRSGPPVDGGVPVSPWLTEQ